MANAGGVARKSWSVYQEQGVTTRELRRVYQLMQMRIYNGPALFLFLSLACIPCSGQHDEEAIRKLSADFSRDYIAGDFESMANRYTDDAVIMPPGTDVVQGRKAILEFWTRTTRPVTHKSVPDRIVIEGDLAHDYGYYYVQSKKPGEEAGKTFSSKYYILWARERNGEWKIKMDMWNNRNPGWNKP